MLMMSRFVSRSFEGVCSFWSTLYYNVYLYVGMEKLSGFGSMGWWMVTGWFELKMMMYGKQ